VREYRSTKFGPVLAGTGTGQCRCGRVISLNKEKCRSCATNLTVHPDILRQLPVLAPGVRGYAMESDGAIYIPVIIADNPGSGDVGRYLDGLPPDRTIRVPNLTSEILEGMLRRRNFDVIVELAPNGDKVDVWERKPRA
jgi:hypothetical protein